MRKTVALILALMLLLGLFAGCGKEEKETTLIVFAAASMTETLNEIAALYKETAPEVKLVFSFESSGTLKTNIEKGADCDLFISAGQKQMNQLDITKDEVKNPERLDYVQDGSRIDEETPPIVTGFFYGATPPEAKYLDSWKGPMRHITLHWEDWRSGGPSLRTETVEVPADWEYLPWEARWDDYTIYMNEGYTKLYAYPGDGTEDYELYLTTAKG